MMYNLIKTIFLFSTIPIFFYLGIITIKSDIMEKKIYNKDLIFCLLLGIILQILSLIILFIFYRESNHLSILYKLPLNVFITLITGIIFWILNLWAAADVKLLFVFSSIMPIQYYISHKLRVFPSFDALVNIFFFAILFILIEIIYSFIKNIKLLQFQKLKNLNKKINRNIIIKISKVIFNIIFMILILNKLRSFLMNYFSVIMKFDMLYIYVLIFMFFNKLSKLLENSIIFIISIIGLFLYIGINIYLKNYSFLNDLLGIISIGFVISIISMILTFYLEFTDQKEIPLHKLSENMILSKKCYQVIEKNKKIDNNFREEIKNSITEGINKEQLDIIKKHYPLKTIFIENTFPFAPFIFIGVLITLILNKSILEIVLNLLYKK